jgi:ribosomal protein L37AE/L43A
VKGAKVACDECGNEFTRRRTDQLYCCGACKSRNARRVRTEKLNLLERLFDQLPKEPQNSKHVKVDLFA